MRVNITEQRSPMFRVLSEDQIEIIYEAALDIVSKTGEKVFHEGALHLFQQSDAIVDGNRVRIPVSMVERAIKDYPSNITVSGRDEKRALHLQKNRVHFGTGSDCPFITDRKTGKRRRYTYNDVAEAARIVDYLPNFDFFMSHGLVSDVPNPNTYDRHQFLAMVSNTAKPLILTSVDGAGLRDLYEMACIIRGSEEEFRINPLFIIYIEPSSPLNHTKEAVEKLLFSAEKSIPAIYTPCPSAGATAPVTLAGMLAQTLAETLFGIVLSNLKKPGMPLIMGGVQTIMDMMTTTFSYGAPELSLASAASTDISKWLGFPMFSTGGCSDSKTVDEQAAIEATLSLYTAMLSGATIVHDVGYLESGLNGSLPMLVLCDEIIDMVKHICKGINVTDDELAIDVIDRVGPGGHFLSDDHTLKYYKERFWFPKLIDRSNIETWIGEGKKTLKHRVEAKMYDILKTHSPIPIDENVLKGLRNIIEKADQTKS
ncbi:MAG: trimethylamine methyltransferase family protein [Spirochaetota bacterium]|nr:MAG: trimethylamine methyltransferase family protein [Spirochaetota bacterium]